MNTDTVTTNSTVEFSFFNCPITKGNAEPIQTISLSQYSDWVKSGRWQHLIEPIREATYDSPTYKNLKAKLPYITPGGIFSVRQKQHFQQFGLIYFDIDAKANPDVDMQKLKNVLSDLDWIAFVAWSSGGSGLQAFAKVDQSDWISDPDRFEYVYARVLEMVEQRVNTEMELVHGQATITFDEAAKTVSQPCFVTYDPEAHFNPKATPLNIQQIITEYQNGGSSDKTDRTDSSVEAPKGRPQYADNEKARGKAIGMIKASLRKLASTKPGGRHNQLLRTANCIGRHRLYLTDKEYEHYKQELQRLAPLPEWRMRYKEQQTIQDGLDHGRQKYVNYDYLANPTGKLAQHLRSDQIQHATTLPVDEKHTIENYISELPGEVDRILDADHNVFVAAKTGLGKTTAFVDRGARLGKKLVLALPNVANIEQAVGDFESSAYPHVHPVGVKEGVSPYGLEEAIEKGANVIVTTYNSMNKIRKAFTNQGRVLFGKTPSLQLSDWTLIIDEAHSLFTDRWKDQNGSGTPIQDLLDFREQFDHWIGLSGTLEGLLQEDYLKQVNASVEQFVQRKPSTVADKLTVLTYGDNHRGDEVCLRTCQDLLSQGDKVMQITNNKQMLRRFRDKLVEDGIVTDNEVTMITSDNKADNDVYQHLMEHGVFPDHIKVVFATEVMYAGISINNEGYSLVTLNLNQTYLERQVIGRARKGWNQIVKIMRDKGWQDIPRLNFSELATKQMENAEKDFEYYRTRINTSLYPHTVSLSLPDDQQPRAHVYQSKGTRAIKVNYEAYIFDAFTEINRRLARNARLYLDYLKETVTAKEYEYRRARQQTDLSDQRQQQAEERQHMKQTHRQMIREEPGKVLQHYIREISEKELDKYPESIRKLILEENGSELNEQQKFMHHEPQIIKKTKAYIQARGYGFTHQTATTLLSFSAVKRKQFYMMIDTLINDRLRESYPDSEQWQATVNNLKWNVLFKTWDQIESGVAKTAPEWLEYLNELEPQLRLQNKQQALRFLRYRFSLRQSQHTVEDLFGEEQRKRFYTIEGKRDLDELLEYFSDEIQDAATQDMMEVEQLQRKLTEELSNLIDVKSDIDFRDDSYLEELFG